MSVAQQLMEQKYGQPDSAYQAKFCMVWKVKQDFPWFPAENILINKDFQLKLVKAFYQIEKAGLQGEIKTFDGCYNERAVRGRAVLSMHAWAAAIDLNASCEKLGQEATNWTEPFITIMRNAGIFWGGDFINRKDPMHFGLLDG